MHDPDANRSPKRNFSQKKTEDGNPLNEPTYIVVNHPGENVVMANYYPLLESVVGEDERTTENMYTATKGTWQAHKSGIYLFGPHLKKFPPIMDYVPTQIKLASGGLDNTYISVKDIKNIYSDSVYPTPKMVVSAINAVRKQAKGDASRISKREDKCSIAELESAIDTFTVDLDKLTNTIRKVATKSGVAQVRLYDPLCKPDCSMLGTDMTHYREEQDRRRKSAERKLEETLLPKSLLEALRGGRRRRITKKAR